MKINFPLEENIGGNLFNSNCSKALKVFLKTTLLSFFSPQLESLKVYFGRRFRRNCCNIVGTKIVSFFESPGDTSIQFIKCHEYNFRFCSPLGRTCVSQGMLKDNFTLQTISCNMIMAYGLLKKHSLTPAQLVFDKHS